MSLLEIYLLVCTTTVIFCFIKGYYPAKQKIKEREDAQEFLVVRRPIMNGLVWSGLFFVLTPFLLIITIFNGTESIIEICHDAMLKGRPE